MRLIMHIDGMGVPVDDGPNFDWSGMMPAMYGADEWPWERIGYSLIRDIYEIERARQHGERAIDQVARHRMDPSIGYDATRVATKEAEGFDPWKERGRLGFQGDADEKAWRMLLPDNMLNAPQWIFEWMKHLEEEGDYMLGLNQIGAMAKAEMGVGGDAMGEVAGTERPSGKGHLPVHGASNAGGHGDMQVQYLPVVRNSQADDISRPGRDRPYDVRLQARGLVSISPRRRGHYQLIELQRPRASADFRNQPPSLDHAQFASCDHADLSEAPLFAVVARLPDQPDDRRQSPRHTELGTLDTNTEFEQWQNYKKKEIEFASAMKDLADRALASPARVRRWRWWGSKGKGWATAFRQ